jgi:hypothetical protein
MAIATRAPSGPSSKLPAHPQVRAADELSERRTEAPDAIDRTTVTCRWVRTILANGQPGLKREWTEVDNSR